MVTQKRLKELFTYCDGNLIRKCTVTYNALKGDVYGSNHKGYLNGNVDGKRYLAHRLVYIYHFGHAPETIDHIDHNTNNNRIENLRPCNKSKNAMNAKLRMDNKSGVKGVHWRKDTKKWCAQIVSNKKHYSLGCYDDLELAELIVNEAREKYHGEFARSY